ncbi:epoxide hydrolase domain-containing protein [Lentinula raphanica]|nr:epoxide hydrolase domain-containing protein [Lentinula raphanica]
MTSDPEPFTVNVPSTFLDWVSKRIDSARIIPDIHHSSGEDWEDGTPTSEMERVVTFWKTQFDWRSVEQKLNETYKMYTIDLEEAGEVMHLHFVHHHSERPGAIPLLFLHGWPGNFTEVENMLGLVNPEDPKAQAFHVVAPSLPGFAFSSSPTKPGFSAARMASLFHQLMNALGYKHYIGQGGDLGAFILRSMANQHPNSCVGIHLNFIMSPPPSPVKSPSTFLRLVLRWFTPSEKQRIERMQWWVDKQFGYAQIQGTKPQTISYGLMDSPVGLLAWIRDKLFALVGPEFVWKDETIILWTMLYLIAGSAENARIYKYSFDLGQQEIFDHILPKEVAVGVSQFRWDTAYLPRWWAEASVAKTIVFWKEHEFGGHFAAVEQGEVLKQDLREFVAKIQFPE